MSIIQEVLYIVSNYPGGYKTIYDILYDSQPPSSTYKNRFENTLRVTLSRLKSRGMIKSDKGKWFISEEGREFLCSHPKWRKNFLNINPVKDDKKKKKNVILLFDIPEKRRTSRDWLRAELLGFGFELVQKSVWLGPALPEEFIEYLSELGILKYIRFFKVSEKDLI